MSEDGKVVQLVPTAAGKTEVSNKEDMLLLLAKMTEDVEAGRVVAVGIVYVLADPDEGLGGTAFDAVGGRNLSHLMTLSRLLGDRLLENL